MKRSLILLMMIFPSLVFAQSNYLKGYFVSAKKDTVHGFVSYKTAQLNPNSFLFKKDLKASPQTYTVDNVLGFGIVDAEVFQKYVINISLSKEDIANLSLGVDTTSKREAVFLLLLQAGKNINLYSYTDKIKIRYYTLEKDATEPKELLKYNYFDTKENNEAKTQNVYISQLTALLSKYNNNVALQDKLSYLGYEKSDFQKATALINNQSIPKAKNKTFRFFAGAGFTSSKIFYSGYKEYSDIFFEHNTSVKPYFVSGFDIFTNGVKSTLFLRIEAQVYSSDNEFTIKHKFSDVNKEYYSLNELSVAIAPQLVANVYNKSNLKLFVAGGFGMTQRYFSNNMFRSFDFNGKVLSEEKDFFKLRKMTIAIPVALGVLINKKFEISAGYNYSPIPSENGLYNINVKRYRAGVSYLF
jgi:hypothetical protein